MPAGTGTLPHQARAALDEYLTALDAALPGTDLQDRRRRLHGTASRTRWLARAKAHRLGDEGVSFTIADGYAACDLIDAVVNDAAAMASRHD